MINTSIVFLNFFNYLTIHIKFGYVIFQIFTDIVEIIVLFTGSMDVYKLVISILNVRLFSLGWIYSLARCLSFWPVKHGPFHNGSSRSQNKCDHVLRVHASSSSSTARSFNYCKPPVGQRSRSEHFK